MSESLTTVGELAENIVETPEPPVQEPVAQQEETKPEGPKTPAWLQRRLDTVARQRGEAERRAVLAEQRAAQAEQLLRKAVEAADPEAAKKMFGEEGTVPPQDIERTITARAEELAAVNAFNAVCNDIYNKGTEEFTDFPDRVKLAQSADVMTPALIEAATEFGDAHRVIYNLTNDLEEATRIAKLSPARMGVALERFMAKQKAVEKKVSAAPPPITPVAGHATPTVDPEKLSHAEWREWRMKQLEAKKKR